MSFRTVASGRLCAVAILPLILLWMASVRPVFAQPVQERSGPTAGAAMMLQIDAESAPFHIQWNGTAGVLTQAAGAEGPGRTMQLAYLRTDPGPKGYARRLTWFLARDDQSFALLWLYLNDTGRDFWCWLYRFPLNRIDTVRFTGSYQIESLPAVGTPSPMPQLDLQGSPRYFGPDFAFGSWSRRAGTLPQLELRNAASVPEIYPGAGADAPTARTVTPGKPDTVTRTLTQLRVTPLHDLRVEPKNGWRAEGWRELHALAYDSRNDPYYLILYSISSVGFVVDLKRAQTYVADFGSRMRFADDNSAFGRKTNPLETPQVARVQRYDIHEITLLGTKTYSSPFHEVVLEADLTSPSGKIIRMPFFWDGAETWRARFSPGQVGTWTWRTRSSDASLHGQTGSIECVADQERSGHGNVQVTRAYASQHHFIYTDGTPFLPIMLSDAVVGLTGFRPGSGSAKPGTGGEPPATFLAFQRAVDACARKGVNRLFGGYLCAADGTGGLLPVNEGGSPVLADDPTTPNPAYFHWLDRRIAYCGLKGIVPDLGIGRPDPALFGDATEETLLRLWRYVVARYSCFNVCWNLFPAAEKAPAPTDLRVTAFAEMTRLYDIYRHPLTTVTYTRPPVRAPAIASSDRLTMAADNRPRRRKRKVEIPDEGSPQSTAAWMDVITSGAMAADLPTRNWRHHKPVVLVDPPQNAEALSGDVLRRRMWETRMRGGYWVSLPYGKAREKLLPGDPEIEMAVGMGQFFAQTRFWRMDPHPELLGGPAQRPGVRRRPQEESGTSAPVPNGQAATVPETKPEERNGDTPFAKGSGGERVLAPIAPGTAAVPATGKTDSVLVLADPAWEYVVYFSQGGSAVLDLLEATGRLRMTWYNPRTGKRGEEEIVNGGAYRTFTPPDGSDWVLHLIRR